MSGNSSTSGIVRPTVAVTTSERGNQLAWWGLRYLVFRAGGRAVRWRPSAAMEAGPPAADALIVAGGVDVDPQLYGGEREPRRWLEPDRDRAETLAIRWALERGTPMLGICRGAQLINVVCGGSLERLERPRRRTTFPSRLASVLPDTMLRQQLRRRQIAINTMHDYAIDELGDGLRVAAVDRRGVPQAIELPSHRVLGVQWHPELMPYARSSRRLICALLTAAGEVAERRA